MWASGIWNQKYILTTAGSGLRLYLGSYDGRLSSDIYTPGYIDVNKLLGILSPSRNTIASFFFFWGGGNLVSFVTSWLAAFPYQPLFKVSFFFVFCFCFVTNMKRTGFDIFFIPLHWFDWIRIYLWGFKWVDLFVCFFILFILIRNIRNATNV